MTKIIGIPVKDTSMRFLLPVFLLFLLTAGSVQAARPLPVALYPPHKHLAYTVFSPESNDDWLCDWALECSTGAPVMQTQDGNALHRVTGWMEMATNRKDLGFVLSSSTLDDAANSSPMLADSHRALQGQGFEDVHPKGGFPDQDGSFFMRAVFDGATVSVYGAWNGTHVVEAVEAHYKSSLSRAAIARYLINLVQAALAVP